MGEGPNDDGLSRHHIIRGVEASLRRLGTDYIDLYQVHEWDGLTPQEETLSALDALVQSGKVRYIGCSNYTGRQLMKALWISDLRGWESYVSQQIYYSLQARDAENELIPIAVEEGLGVLVWSPLAGGLLSGQVPARAGCSRGQQAVRGLDRAAGRRRGPALRHRGRAGRDRAGPRRVGRAGRARVHPGQAGGDVGDRGSPDRGAAARQPGGRRADVCRSRRSIDWTPSVRCRCCTRTGIRPTRNPPASARRISASSAATCPGRRRVARRPSARPMSAGAPCWRVRPARLHEIGAHRRPVLDGRAQRGHGASAHADEVLANGWSGAG